MTKAEICGNEPAIRRELQVGRKSLSVVLAWLGLEATGFGLA